jgi:hypothetical protein
MRIAATRTSLTAILLLPLLAAACAVDRGSNDAVGSTASPLTQASPTTLAPWVVELQFSSNARCSGMVLSEHYLLTAAHCVTDQPNPSYPLQVAWADAPGGRQALYYGLAYFYAHNQYHAHAFPPDTENDIALIMLGSGAGIDLSQTGRAKLWGYSQPWMSASDADRQFSQVGWGLGDPSGGDNCVDGTNGVKRYGTGLILNRTDPYPLVAQAPTVSTHPCQGDSGSPWLFERDGQLIAFAVWTDWWPDLLVAGNFQEGPFITPKVQWMFDTTHLTALQLVCGLAGYAGGEGYLECVESQPPPPPPPRAGTACPSGQHCCNPNPDGPDCLQCLPRGVSCP